VRASCVPSLASVTTLTNSTLRVAESEEKALSNSVPFAQDTLKKGKITIFKGIKSIIFQLPS